MKLKRDTKSGEESTNRFKIGIRNLTKFLPCTPVSKIFILMGPLEQSIYCLSQKKYRGIIFHETKEGNKIWKGTDLSFQNCHKEFDKI